MEDNDNHNDDDDGQIRGHDNIHDDMIMYVIHIHDQY